MSTINLVTVANFSIFFLQYHLHFSLANELYPLILWRYSLELFFLTGQILWSCIFNFRHQLLSLKLFCLLFFFLSSFISKFASSELQLFRPNWTKFDLSELYSNWKSLCSSPKSSLFFPFLKILPLYWSSWLVCQSLLFSALRKVIWAQFCLHFLLCPIVRR